MAPLPRPSSQVPGLIFAAYEAENQAWDSLGFSPSALGTECDRALWLMLHWAGAQEVHDGRQLRLFQSGHIGEERMIADLKRAGLEVYEVDPETGKQFSARMLAGHVRGKLDGLCRGVPEAPAKWHVIEIKTANAKNFAAIKKKGVVAAKPEYFIQANLYMGIRGIDRCLFCVASKDNDDIHIERLSFDHEAFVRLTARLERIIRANVPPARPTEKRDAFMCKWCRQAPVCWGESFARLNCRTCLHSSPTMEGDAAWTCDRWAKPLSMQEQKEACQHHLYVPDLVPGVQGEVDEERETISYTLRDGRTWVDGQDRADGPAPIEACQEE